MKKILFVALLFLVMQSCITSLYPLYTENTLVTKKELVATWKDKEGMYWKFYQNDKAKKYHLRLRAHNYFAEYEVGMVKIEGNYFLDVVMQEQPISDEEAARMKKEEAEQKKGNKNIAKSDVGFLAYNIPGHSFYKLGFKGEKIYVYPFNEDYLKELFEQRKIRIKHEDTDSSTTVLTASTKELQEFFQKYGNDAKLFDVNEPKILSKVTQKN